MSDRSTPPVPASSVPDIDALADTIDHTIRELAAPGALDGLGTAAGLDPEAAAALDRRVECRLGMALGSKCRCGFHTVGVR